MFENNPISASETPLFLKPWLSCQTALTEKLSLQSGQARVEVLSQDIRSCAWFEKQFLKLQEPSVCCRQVMIWSGQHSCWYARTLIPVSSMEREASFFARLEHETLGKLIFPNPNVKRLSLHAYPINANCLEYYWLPESQRALADLFWGRVSLFSVNEASLFYLFEIFLPGLSQCLSKK